MLKKLAVIRSKAGRQCPYGLSVGLGCSNAGDSVKMMTPLDAVPNERVQKQKEHNIAVYVTDGNGRCIFADRLMLEHHAVHCDFGEGGAGIRDTPSPPITIGPRIYQPGGLTGYYSYPIWSYMDNPEIMRVYNTYASTDDNKEIKKAWWNDPGQQLLKIVEVFALESTDDK